MYTHQEHLFLIAQVQERDQNRYSNIQVHIDKYNQILVSFSIQELFWSESVTWQ